MDVKSENHLPKLGIVEHETKHSILWELCNMFSQQPYINKQNVPQLINLGIFRTFCNSDICQSF